MVNATNTINQGLLEVESSGLIRVEGANLDLSRGALHVLPGNGANGAGCFGFQTETNFLPDVGLSDIYWGIGDANMRLDTGTLNLPTPTTPIHNVTNTFGRIRQQFGLFNPYSHVYTNVLGTDMIMTTNTLIVITNGMTNVVQQVTNNVVVTNMSVQIAYVGRANDPNLIPTVLFAPDPLDQTPRAVVVGWSASENDPVTGGTITYSLYLVDYIASRTNSNILTNLNTGNTFIPSPYLLTRCAPTEFFTGDPSNTVYSPNLIWNNTYTNRVVTNHYAGYAADAAAGFTLPLVVGGTQTNLPGRIEIVADTLDLTKTRIRADEYLSIKSQNFVSSSNAAISVPQMSLNLTSASGIIDVRDIGSGSVVRLGGQLAVWSAIWTNFSGSVLTNTVPDPLDTNVPPMLIETYVTNTTEMAFHLLMVDPLLQAVRPVIVNEFVVHSDQTSVSNNLTVSDLFLIDADSITLAGNINDQAGDAGGASFPRVNHFTNNGTFSVANVLNLGRDRARLVDIVNHGTLAGSAIFLKSEYLENTDSLLSQGVIELDAFTAKFEGGGISAANDLRLLGDSAKFRNTTINASALFLAVGSSLQDSGAGANNLINVTDGFNLVIKPDSGDLLGTTLRTEAPPFSNVRHTWAAEDLGPVAEGYTNNTAIGRLILSAGADGLLTFAGGPGVTGGKAIYADFLELQGQVLADPTNTVVIDPSITIYFADANVPVEQLDGKFGGHLVWVSSFAGPNSSVDVLLPDGRTIRVNRALRESKTIDSDGDGIPNGNDLTPFGSGFVPSISVTRTSPQTAKISWETAPGMVYQLDYTTSLQQPAWTSLKSYTNNAPGSLVTTVTDTVPVGSQQRFYRVRSSPR
jgi:hypothetical protein